MSFILRLMKSGEEPQLFRIFHSAIRLGACEEYSPEQLRAWAPDDFDADLWKARVQKLRPFVIELNSELVGYSDLQADGLIDHFYVSGRHQRIGVGSALMNHIHEKADQLGITTLYSHVSLTAEGFFLKQGFRIIERRTQFVRGVELRNAMLQKRLS